MRCTNCGRENARDGRFCTGVRKAARAVVPQLPSAGFACGEVLRAVRSEPPGGAGDCANQGSH